MNALMSYDIEELFGLLNLPPESKFIHPDIFAIEYALDGSNIMIFKFSFI